MTPEGLLVSIETADFLFKVVRPRKFAVKIWWICEFSVGRRYRQVVLDPNVKVGCRRLFDALDFIASHVPNCQHLWNIHVVDCCSSLHPLGGVDHDDDDKEDDDDDDDDHDDDDDDDDDEDDDDTDDMANGNDVVHDAKLHRHTCDNPFNLIMCLLKYIVYMQLKSSIRDSARTFSRKGKISIFASLNLSEHKFH